MTDRELLELIAAQVGILIKDVSELKEGQNTLAKDVSELKEGQNTLAKDVSELKEGQNTLTKDVSELKEGQDTLAKDVSAIKEDIKLLGHELHIEIQAVYDNVEGLRADLNTMEIITTKNAFDIAKLKSVR